MHVKLHKDRSKNKNKTFWEQETVTLAHSKWNIEWVRNPQSKCQFWRSTIDGMLRDAIIHAANLQSSLQELSEVVFYDELSFTFCIFFTLIVHESKYFSCCHYSIYIFFFVIQYSGKMEYAVKKQLFNCIIIQKKILKKQSPNK